VKEYFKKIIIILFQFLQKKNQKNYFGQKILLKQIIFNLSIVTNML